MGEKVDSHRGVRLGSLVRQLVMVVVVCVFVYMNKEMEE